MPLSPRARTLLLVLALLGLVLPNGVFLWRAALHWPDFVAELTSPVGLALMVDAFAATGVLAFLLARRPLAPFGWKSFLALSLLGGLAFSVPLVAARGRSEGERRP